ncbi:MAG: mechanosensitive ion channel family protein [bacterium]
MRLLLSLSGIYLCIIFFRQALRHKGERRFVFLVTSLFLLLPLVAASLLYARNILQVFDRELPANRDPANWWIVPVTPEQGEPWFLNILATLIIFSLLYIVTDLLISSVAFFMKKRGIELLSMHKALIKWCIVLGGCVLFLRINLWPVILGMGAASIVLGFALKEMLENLFTGMALDTEGAFHSGDWIRIGDSETIGKVYEKNWRSTKLVTLEDECITVPNRLLGAEKILCYNKPNPLFARQLRVGTSYNDPPVKVKEVLRTILMREPAVAKAPPPLVKTIEYGDFAIVYEMKYWIDDYGEHRRIADSIMTKIWYAFKFYGIEIPFPIRTVHMKERDQIEHEQEENDKEVEAKIACLQGLAPFRRHLRARDLDFLARNSFRKRYAAGEHVLLKGEIGDALYLVTEGSCLVLLPDGRKPRIGAGHYFGEMGLLGGRQRTADVVAGEEGAVVVRTDKHCMDVLFRTYPDLLQEFEQIRDARKQELPPEAPVQSGMRVHPFLKAIRYTADFLRPW